MSDFSENTLRDFLNSYTRFRSMLAEAQEVVLDSDVSEFPVFVFSKVSPEIGVKLYDSVDPERDWFVHATSLEELVAKNIIDPSRVEEFKKVYKDPTSYFCILLLDGAVAQFAFPPIHGIPFSNN
ncbi:MAG TPA: hypothetical protein VKZ56_10995 [Membranihabitans sp.]|nr:hypothetical protein [Membranihabitans sp.]